jgi:hypothetical protein
MLTRPLLRSSSIFSRAIFVLLPLVLDDHESALADSCDYWLSEMYFQVYAPAAYARFPPREPRNL